MVLSTRVELLLIALLVAVMALRLIGVLRAVSAPPNNADNRNDSERVRSPSWSRPAR